LAGSISEKDGPSATGIITVSILSRLTGIPVRNDIACTGEACFVDCSLTKIGGLESKMEGAILEGIHGIVISRENEEDLDLLIRKYEKQRNHLLKHGVDINIVEEDDMDRDIEYKTKYTYKKYKNLDVYVVDNLYELLDIVMVEKIEYNQFL